jgi:predicted AlkP superfamily phosphohydrolase/phosphomutase
LAKYKTWREEEHTLAPKVAVIGLDCAEPQLVFSRWLDDLPNLRSLIQAGAWGRLRTIDPPISVPAWSCMVSSRDPGELGIYGFRNRKDYSYNGLAFADSRWLKVERLWDLLGQAGKHAIAIGVPQTYPPLPINGEMISCFLTPDPRKNEYTHPPALRQEIEGLVGDYQVDVQNFRSNDRDRILSEIYEMTEQRFAVARHLLETRPWDFFMMVEIGLDRIQHAFWRYLDTTHPQHEAHSRYEHAIRTYYQYLDDQIGELLERFDDDTTILVVSDHGAQPMEGGICVNEWLMREGYLTLRQPPTGTVPFAQAEVDWSRTRAWGEGGYYCRLCLNVQGREPEGTVAPGDYDRLRDELIARLEALPGPDGRSIGTRVFRPEELWPVRNGIAPDLIVYFGNLAWRSVGSIGHGDIYTFENDTGPDDANHSAHGLFVMSGPRVSGGRRDDLRIYDVAPTILDVFGIPVPAGMRGQVVGLR